MTDRMSREAELAVASTLERYAAHIRDGTHRPRAVEVQNGAIPEDMGDWIGPVPSCEMSIYVDLAPRKDATAER